jgi:arabinogalactan oligomer / maltooligosaccharide transport system substrate-binding protein
MRTNFLFTCLFLLLLSLAACTFQNGDSDLDAATPSPPAVTPPPTATPSSSASPAVQNTPSFVIPPTVTPSSQTLIIWLPPAIASRTEAGAVTLADHLLTFNLAHPELEIIIEQKSTSGQGGSLNYLRTGQAIAPSILPDLIALPATQLAATANEGLILPMEEFLDPALVNNMFPLVQEWAWHNGHLVGIPFALTEVLHLEYSGSITESISLDWPEFIADPMQNMVLPAAGPAGGRLLLQFYLAAGGRLTNEAGQPALELAPLTQALEQLHNGRLNGFILQQSSNIVTLPDSVRLVRDGVADYGLTSSDVFLQSISTGYIPRFAAAPGFSDSLPPLANGWAWATTTPDPVKKALVAELIVLLTEPERLGNWSWQSQILPTLPAALATWENENAYVAFAQAELQRAMPMPLLPTSPILAALENAVFDVISLSKTPAAAAAEAVAALEP